MKQGEMVLVHLSDAQIEGLKGNKLSPMPAIVVSVWENEYAHHPKCTTGVNVRVFTDTSDNPLWLTSLPMNFEGAKKMFGDQCAFFEKITNAEVHTTNIIYQGENKKSPLLVDGFPRRNRLDLNAPAELSIHNAIQEIEKLPADIRLSNAQILLDQAKSLVSDFIDEQQPG